MIKRLESWIRNIVWEESQEASKHFKQPPDQTADIVKLLLDLHDKKWSFQSDRFLRNLNIDPMPYWNEFNKDKK